MISSPELDVGHAYFHAMPSNKSQVLDLLVNAARRHGSLSKADVGALRELTFSRKFLEKGEDAVCQGDRPEVAIFVLNGMLARYHTLPSGDRQYLSLHMQGDMPDVQSLFLKIMDHSVCALDSAEIAEFDHKHIMSVFLKRPGIGFAFWRMTLVDAAIFRQHITDNSARSHTARLAHLFCEQVTRASNLGLPVNPGVELPLTQVQLGQLLGMSHISVNRAAQKIRRLRLADMKRNRVDVLDWTGLCKYAGFDPTYLHLEKESEAAKTTFRGRS
jgi:CRP-like cAMP-binding protein